MLLMLSAREGDRQKSIARTPRTNGAFVVAPSALHPSRPVNINGRACGGGVGVGCEDPFPRTLDTHVARRWSPDAPGPIRAPATWSPHPTPTPPPHARAEKF